MHLSLSYIYIGITILSLCIFAYKYMGKFIGKITHQVDYIKKGDPTAQGSYEAQFQDPNPMNKDEKIELSWQFLYDITDYVLSKFSQADKEQATRLGNKLLEFGTNYEHVIEYGLKSLKKRVGIEVEAEQQKDGSGIAL